MSCSTTWPPRSSSRPMRASSSWTTPSRSRTRRPTTGSSSARSRRSWPAIGGSSCDADEPRAHFPPRRPYREGARHDDGREREGARRAEAGGDPGADRGIEAGRVDRRRGPEDPRILLAPDARGEPRVGGAVPEDSRGSVSQEVPALKRLVVGITGATGSIYGIRLLEILRGHAEVQTHLVISAPGKRTIVEETAYTVRDVEALAAHHYDIRDIGASIASGSFRTVGMVIAPCSIKTAGAIASCHTDSLIPRAADVTLKEGPPLIMLVRETPLHVGHLQCLPAPAEVGAVMLPPMPAFYNRPKGLDDIVNHTIARVLDRLNLPQTLVDEWPGTTRRGARAEPGD